MSGAELSAGQTIGEKYRIERKLGSGAMGVVYEATQTDLGRKVAVKVMLAAARVLPDADIRFLREARAAAALESEHAVNVIDTGRLDDDTPFFVMEHLDGEDLARHIRRVGALPVQEAVSYVMQAAEAIHEAHQRGIIHRDLKPANIFLAKRFDGTVRVVVLDFGLAKDAGGLGTAGLDATGQSTVLGSPMYMAPEQVRASKNVDSRVDVWALGVVLQELLTAKPVFHAETITALSAMIAADAPAAISRGDVPQALQTAVTRCLEKDPQKRFPSVKELLEALRPFGPPSSRISTMPPPARILSDAPPASKPPDALGDTVFASGQHSGATTKVSPTGLAEKRPPRKRWLLLVPLVAVAAGAVVWAKWPGTSGPTPTPTTSSSVPVSSSVVAIPPVVDAAAGPCVLDPRPIAPIHGNVQFAYIGAGTRLFSIAARATVAHDGGRRIASFIGTLDPLGKGELHPPATPLLDTGDVFVGAASIRGAPQFAFFQNRTPDENRGGAIMSFPVKGDFGPGAAVANPGMEATDLAVASRAHEMLAVVVGREFGLRTTPSSPASGWVLEGWLQTGNTTVLKNWPAETKDPPRGPAAAVGHDCRAVAFRTVHQIHVAWLTTEPTVDVWADLGSGDVGAPAIAIHEDVLTIVWAERASAMEAYRLHYATWNHGKAAPTSPKTLESGAASAFAPAVAVSAKRTAVAWMEEEGGTSRVRVGVGPTIEDATKTPMDASPPGVKSGDPELSALDDEFGLVWVEHATKGEIRAAVTQCK